MTATIPRERGLSTQADSVKPCAGGASRPSCSNTTGTMWNWTSGAGRSPRVRAKPPFSPMLEVSGPWPCIHSARLASLSASLSELSSSQKYVTPAVGWSWRFMPTSGDSATSSICSSSSSSGRPIPDSVSSCGEL